MCKNQAMSHSAAPSRLGDTHPHRVVVVALDGVIPFEFSIPARLFGAARDGAGRPLYEVVTASVGAEPVRTNADFAINPHAELAGEIRSADTVVIPAVQLSELDARQVGVVTEMLKDRPPGSRIMSICTGAYVLASAGLLDGRPATTHWNHAGAFAPGMPPGGV
jgi:transcriptional regulator GlxA family with amidase domain